MKITKSRQMSESYIIGVLLTSVGGFLDAYTYMCRGQVFANAQTGNLVLMSIKIAQGNLLGGLYYLIPILAFVFGIIIAEKIKHHFREVQIIHWRQIIILAEIIILSGIAFIPQGNLDVICNILVSFVCALQVQSFRKIAGKSYASTMCTGNLRSGTEHLSNYFHTKKKDDLFHAMKYYGIILIFAAGAAIGGLLTEVLGITAILIAVIGLAAAFCLLFIRKKA